jgi:(p)ppGpp synthase/HD superfamily hydrolase
MLNAMLVLATNSHAGQFDKGGNPYILHPLAVMQLLKDPDEEQRCIAVGHDVAEDCGVTWAQMRELGISERVIDGIRCMTKIPGESYEEYQVKVKSNKDAIKVKIADLTHNTDIRRLKGVSPKDVARMEKYFKFYMELVALNK